MGHKLLQKMGWQQGNCNLSKRARSHSICRTLILLPPISSASPPPYTHTQVEAESSIGADNVGHKLLQKMGWQQGKGIGAKESGITAPVGPGAGAAAAGQNLGLGAEAHGAVKEDDDPFEQYRKRMMLGYKYVC